MHLRAITHLLLLISLLLGFSSCSGKPSTSEAREIIEKQIESQASSKIKLVSLKKTNGVEQEVFGQKIYSLEYAVEIEFLDDCMWIYSMDGGYDGFNTAPIPAKTGGGLFDALLRNGTEHKKGERVKANGQVLFQKTENGWRPVNILIASQ